MPLPGGEALLSDILPTPEQEAEAQRLAALVAKKAQQEVLHMVRILAAKPDSQLLGLPIPSTQPQPE